MEVKKDRPKSFTGTRGYRNLRGNNMIVTKRYPLLFPNDGSFNLVECPEEIFFKDEKGRLYALYYKGQLISDEAYSDIFSKVEQDAVQYDENKEDNSNNYEEKEEPLKEDASFNKKKTNKKK